MGAGVEEIPGMGNTPGFTLHQEPRIVDDFRGFKNYEAPRNSIRMVQTPLFALMSWRANCKVDWILYESDPNAPDPADIANVLDYCVSYACKGNQTLTEEKNQIRDLIHRLVALSLHSL